MKIAIYTTQRTGSTMFKKCLLKEGFGVDLVPGEWIHAFKAREIMNLPKSLSKANTVLANYPSLLHKKCPDGHVMKLMYNQLSRSYCNKWKGAHDYSEPHQPEKVEYIRRVLAPFHVIHLTRSPLFDVALSDCCMMIAGKSHFKADVDKINITIPDQMFTGVYDKLVRAEQLYAKICDSLPNVLHVTYDEIKPNQSGKFSRNIFTKISKFLQLPVNDLNVTVPFKRSRDQYNITNLEQLQNDHIGQ